MSIPKNIKIKNNRLPSSPGVYLMRDKTGKVIYAGKASSLRTRVGSYFSNRPKDAKTAELAGRIARIDYIRTKTALEAVILEAAKIKKFKPKYNIIQKDDRSFLYLAITKEKFPRPLLIRGHEFKNSKISRQSGIPPFPLNKSKEAAGQIPNSKFYRVFGPFVSPNALRAALNILRKIFPWSECSPPKKGGKPKPCFDYHLKRCAGVCVGAITPRDYKRIIRGLVLFFEGKRDRVIRDMEKQMREAKNEERFEDAALCRNRLFAMEHIQDISVLTKDMEAGFGSEEDHGINIFGRIEAYDISNISGTSAVGGMAVFKDGEPSYKDYRKFKIKTVGGSNDIAMLREILLRRFSRRVSGWPLPDIILIDGGAGQVNAANAVLKGYKLGIPVTGIAKGADRKKDELILPKDNPEMERVTKQYKHILVAARDEAHRFAVSYYRRTHRRKMLS